MTERLARSLSLRNLKYSLEPYWKNVKKFAGLAVTDGTLGMGGTEASLTHSGTAQGKKMALNWQDMEGGWETVPAKAQPWDGDEEREKQEASPQVTRGTGWEGEERLATRIQWPRPRREEFPGGKGKRTRRAHSVQCGPDTPRPSQERGKQGWLSPNAKGHRQATQL